MLFTMWGRIKRWRSLKTPRHLVPPWIFGFKHYRTMSLSLPITSTLIWNILPFSGGDLIQEIEHKHNYRKMVILLSIRFLYSLFLKSSCRPWAWGNTPDGISRTGRTLCIYFDSTVDQISIKEAPKESIILNINWCEHFMPTYALFSR